MVGRAVTLILCMSLGILADSSRARAADRPAEGHLFRVVVEGAWLVTDLADPMDRIARKLPQHTPVFLRDSRLGRRWAEVDVLDELGGRGWVASRFLVPIPRDVVQLPPRGVEVIWPVPELQTARAVALSGRPSAMDDSTLELWEPVVTGVPRALGERARPLTGPHSPQPVQAPLPAQPPQWMAQTDATRPVAPSMPAAAISRAEGTTWDGIAILCVLLGALGLWWAQRIARGGRPGRSVEPLKVEQVRTLGPQTALAVVRAGGARLVLACSADEVTLLRRESAVAAAEQKASAPAKIVVRLGSRGAGARIKSAIGAARRRNPRSAEAGGSNDAGPNSSRSAIAAAPLPPSR